ncbi:MAG: DUF3990 domain-containing protein [Oscillospiraceae bacterium]|nr:DUF3990 domain-containing protein [Oscillospiraceae bacterium]
MQTFIKQIRAHLDMSQSEFAELLNVTFASVNRWENGRTVPNKLAQTRIYEICKAHGIPAYALSLNRMKHIADGIELPPERMLLYHGSKSGIEGAIAPVSRPQCDFGKGFYMGTELAQALTLICDYEQSKLYLVSLDLRELDVIDVPANLDWAMLVAYHRGRMEKISGTALYEKYRLMTAHKDVVIGSIANDRMFYVIDNFFIGNITDAALVGSLSALQLGRQYVAISQKACDAVRIEKEIEISHLERLFIKDVAEENRVKGVSMANDICKIHRREGLFFDELLDKASIGEV